MLVSGTSVSNQPQQMVVMHGGGSGQQAPTASVITNDAGPVTSDAALAQLAAEAGLLEGEVSGSVSLLPGSSVGGQVDGGTVTPQEGEIGDYGQVDLSQYLNMYTSQCDGDPGEVSEEAGEEAAKDSEADPAVAGETAAADAITPQPSAAATTQEKDEEEEKPVSANPPVNTEASESADALAASDDKSVSPADASTQESETASTTPVTSADAQESVQKADSKTENPSEEAKPIESKTSITTTTDEMDTSEKVSSRQKGRE